MESWSKDFFQALEAVADQVEQFFEDVAHDVSDALDIWSDVTEEIAEQWEAAIETELEQLDQWLEPFFQELLGLEADYFYTIEDFNARVGPDPEQHPACIGCRHYHGQIYGGHLLICAMHPYGYDARECPDWESILGWKPDEHDNN